VDVLEVLDRRRLHHVHLPRPPRGVTPADLDVAAPETYTGSRSINNKGSGSINKGTSTQSGRIHAASRSERLVIEYPRCFKI
jgi:hypothetical protein